MEDLTKKKIQFFRAYRDPSIGPKPAFAFHTDAMKLEVEHHPEGIFVRTQKNAKNPTGSEHLVPWANVESVRYVVEDSKNKKVTDSAGK